MTSVDSAQTEPSDTETDVRTDAKPWVRHRRLIAGSVVLVVVVAAVIGGVESWRGGGERPGPREGVIREQVVVGGDLTTVEFRLPGGRKVNVGVAVAHDGEDNGWEGSVRPPQGGRFVEVRWGETRTGASGDGEPEVSGPVRLELRSDGRGFPLSPSPADEDEPVGEGEPSADTSSTVVALAGRWSRLSVEAVFAGRRQSVDVATGQLRPGSFAPLYSDSSVSLSAPETNRYALIGGLRIHQTFALQASRLPYVAGLGWARPGRDWLLVRGVSLGASAPETPDRDLDLTTRQAGKGGSLAVGGRGPARRLTADRFVITEGRVHCYQPGSAVFDVPAAKPAAVDVRYSYQVEAQGGGRSPLDGRTFTVTDGVDIPVLESRAV